MKRVRRLRDRFVGGVIRQIEALPEEQLLRGHARFTGPTTLNVGGHTLVEAGAVVIATGSVPHIPAPFDAIRDRVMINDDVFDLEDLPASIAVIGAGIIGLEIGQALHRLGVRTSLFARSERIGPFTDPEVCAVATDVFREELDLRLNTKITAADAVDAGVRIRFVEGEGTNREEVFERVLVATGRRPNVFDIDLQAAGLPVDDHGLPAWDPETTQCGNAPIFIAGDASGHIELLHEASDEGRIAGANALAYPDVESHERRTPLAIAFTDPQIALVGRHHAQLDPDAVEIGQVSFARQGRATVMDRAAGLLRVYGDRESCAVIGARTSEASASAFRSANSADASCKISCAIWNGGASMTALASSRTVAIDTSPPSATARSRSRARFFTTGEKCDLSRVFWDVPDRIAPLNSCAFSSATSAKDLVR